MISIQLLCQEKRQERRAFRLLARSLRSQQRLYRTATWFTVWSSLAIVMGMSAVVGYGGKSVLAGTLTIGSLVAFYGLLLIHLSGGRIETHFHVFGSLAFMAFYRDWRVLAWASSVVAADHFVRGIFWPQSVYGVLAQEKWRWAEHTFWVVFEDMFLVIASRQSLHQIFQSAERQAMVEALNVRLRNAMTETHHRVKNNLQLIAAMVDMQVMDDGETIPTEELKRLGSHVRSLAVVHDILTEQAKCDGQAHVVSARAILERLLEAMRPSTGRKHLAYRLEDFEVTSRRGTALALVTNELVNNALKHGRSCVTVTLWVTGAHAILEVRDDGAGFAEGFDPARSANTGLELVEHLVRSDLEAEAHYDIGPGGGGRVRITVPVKARLCDSSPPHTKRLAYT